MPGFVRPVTLTGFLAAWERPRSARQTLCMCSLFAGTAGTAEATQVETPQEDESTLLQLHDFCYFATQRLAISNTLLSLALIYAERMRDAVGDQGAAAVAQAGLCGCEVFASCCILASKYTNDEDRTVNGRWAALLLERMRHQAAHNGSHHQAHLGAGAGCDGLTAAATMAVPQQHDAVEQCIQRALAHAMGTQWAEPEAKAPVRYISQLEITALRLLQYGLYVKPEAFAAAKASVEQDTLTVTWCMLGLEQAGHLPQGYTLAHTSSVSSSSSSSASRRSSSEDMYTARQSEHSGRHTPVKAGSDVHRSSFAPELQTVPTSTATPDYLVTPPSAAVSRVGSFDISRPPSAVPVLPGCEQQHAAAYTMAMQPQPHPQPLQSFSSASTMSSSMCDLDMMHHARPESITPFAHHAAGAPVAAADLMETYYAKEAPVSAHTMNMGPNATEPVLTALTLLMLAQGSASVVGGHGNTWYAQQPMPTAATWGVVPPVIPPAMSYYSQMVPVMYHAPQGMAVPHQLYAPVYY